MFNYANIINVIIQSSSIDIKFDEKETLFAKIISKCNIFIKTHYLYIVFTMLT